MRSDYNFDQVILSTNENLVYRDFWPVVSWAYKKMFPEVTPHLAFLTERTEDDPLVLQYREHGHVTLFPVLPDVPEFAQAKVIRLILASQQGTDVCYIDDIDLFPLSRDFIANKTRQRPLNHLLCVGGEVYNNNGCYPMSQLTGEGWLFKKFVNLGDMSSTNLIRYWKGKSLFDRREDVCIPNNWEVDDYFSDERLIRRLLYISPVPKFELPRGYDNYLEATLDRADWKVDVEKLNAHGYVNAHGIRPYAANAGEYGPLISYIQHNYS